MQIVRSTLALIAAVLIAAIPLPSPAQLSVGVGFTVGAPPPALPVYSMPPAPYPNYQWTPGYWGWGAAGYYWTPGTWVAPPAAGLYWTPGYWGFSGAGYGWNGGYWGTSVGFYGGVNYGFGYYGSGFAGGVWSGGAFRYNTAVVNVNRTYIHNTYNKTVINNYNHSRVSYNGGHGGISARPTQAQVAARHSGRPPTTAQKDQARLAASDRNLYASVNKGKPPITASTKPFSDKNPPPHSAPVTTADKQAAQNQLKSNSAPASQNQPQANAPKHNAPPANHHVAPVSQPKHNQPPPAHHLNPPPHNAPVSHPNEMKPHPANAGEQHPPKNPPENGQQKPPDNGKPPPQA